MTDEKEKPPEQKPEIVVKSVVITPPTAKLGAKGK
jgi:hypothetical protein